MIIVSFKELCAMPVGTIFQQYEPHHLGYLSIFGGALPEGSDEPKDFLQASLTPSAMMGSYWTAEPAKLADGSFTDEDGLYIVTPSDYGRWAIYEYDIRFLVWEQADRERLAGWLLNPALAADQMNDDPHAIIEVPPVQTT